jgi:hypothetical protein
MKLDGTEKPVKYKGRKDTEELRKREYRYREARCCPECENYCAYIPVPAVDFEDHWCRFLECLVGAGMVCDRWREGG